MFGNSSVSGGPAYYNYGKSVGALVTFYSNVTTLQSKVGISFVSTENSCNHIQEEIPQWNLNQTKSEAEDAWESVLNKISTTDLSNSTRLEMFYRALYHTHLMPTDRTAENPNWETSEPSYSDFYTFWDTFRCFNSLWTLISTQRSIDMMCSIIDIWRNE